MLLEENFYDLKRELFVGSATSDPINTVLNNRVVAFPNRFNLENSFKKDGFR